MAAWGAMCGQIELVADLGNASRASGTAGKADDHGEAFTTAGASSRYISYARRDLFRTLDDMVVAWGGY